MECQLAGALQLPHRHSVLAQHPGLVAAPWSVSHSPVAYPSARAAAGEDCMVEGRSMKEVAFMLKVSPRTVAFHKYAMMENLRLKSSAELIRCAVKDSLVAC